MTPAKTDQKLTKWEAGQELVKVADCLSEAASELKSWPALQRFMLKLRDQLQRKYKRDGFTDTMGFGI